MTTDFRLLTRRLRLRRWKPEDRAPFREMNADPRVMEYYPNTLSAGESDRIVEAAERHFDTHGFGLYATELRAGGEFIGFVGLQWVPFEERFTPAVEIGWRIAHRHWNQGYATEAARRVLDFAFEDLALSEVVAMTYRENLRSRRVMEKLGMVHDPEFDFENPRLPEGNRLRPHVLYRLGAGSHTFGR